MIMVSVNAERGHFSSKTTVFNNVLKVYTVMKFKKDVYLVNRNVLFVLPHLVDVYLVYSHFS